MKKHIFLTVVCTTLFSGCMATVSPGGPIHARGVLFPLEMNEVFFESPGPVVIVKHSHPVRPVPFFVSKRPERPHLHSHQPVGPHKAHGKPHRK